MNDDDWSAGFQRGFAEAAKVYMAAAQAYAEAGLRLGLRLGPFVGPPGTEDTSGDASGEASGETTAAQTFVSPPIGATLARPGGPDGPE